MHKLQHAPHPCLRAMARAVRVEEELAALRPLLREMSRCILANNARGLAAPQLGESIRCFMLADDESAPMQTYFNPRIVRASRQKSRRWETCLSVPGHTGLVERARSAHVEYEAADSRTVQAVLRGSPAAVFQHELDHLNGVLFVDIASKLVPVVGDQRTAGGW
jgi:peptide deformylase